MLKKFLFLVSLLTTIFLLTAPLKSFADEPIGTPLGKQIKITSNLSYNQKRGAYVAKVVLKNQKNSKTTFRGSLALLVQSINKPGISLANASGQTSAGLGYVEVPLPAQGLKPGKTTKKVTLIFKSSDRKKPKNLKIRYAAYLGLASSANFGSSSGAFGVLALNNARIVFIPTGTTIKPVLLESANGVSIKAKPIETKITEKVGPTLNFSADACTVDSAALKLICVGYDSTKIALLDLSKFVSTFTASDIVVSEFDSGAPNTRLSFSGGSCTICGVAADTGENRFIVAANDGYRVYSYASSAATGVFPIPVSENFAYDSVRNRIIAPEYEPAPGSTNRVFNIVNLNNNKVYRWNKSTSSCSDLGSQTSTCSGARAEIDSAAVDLATGIVQLIFEFRPAVAMIDMGQASFDEATQTFLAPSFYTEADAPRVSIAGAGAASATQNYLFLSEEFGASETGVMRLPATSGTGGAFPAVNPNPVFVDLRAISNPECSSSGSVYAFATKGDPHGLALFTGLIGGKQTGLLIDSSDRCAALIDLAGLHGTLRNASDPTQVDASIDLRASNFVRFIKLQ
jgi:hypothetical protein